MRMTVLGRFILWLSILTGLLFASVNVLIAQFGTFFTLPVRSIGIYLLSFYAVSAVSGYLVIRSQSKRGALLVRSIMGSTIIKFFLYIIALSAFVLSTEAHAKEIGFYFFTFYVSFTLFEKAFLIRALSGGREEAGGTVGDGE